MGFGEDTRALVPGRKLVLGGVEIPHETGLLGHSDADALTHAVIDALLGAAALGDIGMHFPDTDARYRGISSGLRFLRETAALLRAHGFLPGNVDAHDYRRAAEACAVHPRYAGSFGAGAWHGGFPH